MGVGLTRDVTQHVQVESFPTTLSRSPSPVFAPPVPTGMQEPGTNYFTIVTAQGPHTLEKPGIGGGITVHANNRNQEPTPPLTHKGG